MSDRIKHGSGKSAFARGADLFATVAAGFAAFFLTSWINETSLPMALRHAEHTFGPGWNGLLTPVWFLACAVATFGLCQMLFALTLRLGLAKVSAWVFR